MPKNVKFVQTPPGPELYEQVERGYRLLGAFASIERLRSLHHTFLDLLSGHVVQSIKQLDILHATAKDMNNISEKCTGLKVLQIHNTTFNMESVNFTRPLQVFCYTITCDSDQEFAKHVISVSKDSLESIYIDAEDMEFSVELVDTLALCTQLKVAQLIKKTYQEPVLTLKDLCKCLQIKTLVAFVAVRAVYLRKQDKELYEQCVRLVLDNNRPIHHIVINNFNRETWQVKIKETVDKEYKLTPYFKQDRRNHQHVVSTVALQGYC